jgi:hypothetical protein
MKYVKKIFLQEIHQVTDRQQFSASQQQAEERTHKNRKQDPQERFQNVPQEPQGRFPSRQLEQRAPFPAAPLDPADREPAPFVEPEPRPRTSGFQLDPRDSLQRGKAPVPVAGGAASAAGGSVAFGTVAAAAPGPNGQRCVDKVKAKI